MRETSIALALSCFSFILAVIWGDPLIRLLQYWKIGKQIRVEEPGFHNVKMGTPTMGGIMFVVPVLIITILLNAVSIFGYQMLGRSILLPMIVMVAFGLLGALDDWEGVRGVRKGLGMRARTKFVVQVVLALGVASSLKYLMQVPEMYFPGYTDPLPLGVFYIPIAAFLIVSSCNAVNFTDGLDGLAGLIAATAFAAYGGIALLQGQIFVGRFCFTLVGSLFGFLWFNVHPAKLFMGDTGSMALGAVLATVALMTGQWLLYPLIAVIPTAEIVSDVLQIIYFKLTKGKRLFKMAPIHLPFELLGWSETQVVQRFWLVSLLFAMLGIALAVV
jgi:phospho-N-acetylmuramoyl-pentapeptide-transferase